ASAALIMALWIALLAIESNPWMIVYLTPGAGVLLLLWGLRRRSLPTLIISVGLLLINPRTVDLPYFWLVTSDVVVISLFLPLAILVGGGGALLYAALPTHQRWPRISATVAAALVLAAAGWGASVQRNVLNQTTVLATDADRAAIAWAAANTPPDARFLVNSSGWLGNVLRGSDGGWWLLPLAGRWTSAPPVLYTYGDPAYVQHVQQMAAIVASYRVGQEQAILDLIAYEHMSYIYLGAKGGPLRAAIFVGRPGFRIVYQVGGVTIIAVAEP
ncbi:MAG: hypothetical protein HGA65_19495, partial [Oscillochloris sp.]|nr:hypothetical protein [Oscillochloris sp.]